MYMEEYVCEISMFIQIIVLEYNIISMEDQKDLI